MAFSLVKIAKNLILCSQFYYLTIIYKLATLKVFILNNTYILGDLIMADDKEKQPNSLHPQKEVKTKPAAPDYKKAD